VDESFSALAIHFFRRFFDGDSSSDESEPRTRMIQMLSLITVGGPLLLFLIAAGPRLPFEVNVEDFRWLTMGFHYLFVCYGMAVMGLVMTYKWDYLFPDRRDYLILTSLPISSKRFFAAKAFAVCVFLLLFVVATNLVPVIGIAVIDTRAIFGHLAGALGGSIFAALFFAAFQGVLINVLTPNGFRRFSPVFQMISITVLVTLLLVLPLLRASVRPLAQMNSRLIDYFPPAWFLGVYESLNFTPAVTPKVGVWAWAALTATMIVVFAFVVSYSVGYRRYSRRMLESIESMDFKPGRLSTAVKTGLTACLLRDPLQHAVFDFVGKIFRRSDRHRILMALYAGTGIALTVSSLFIIDVREAFPFRLSRTALLEAPAILSFVAVAGLRSCFNVPYELAANWIFRIVDGGADACRTAIRKWVYVCGLLPLYLLMAIFEFAWFAPRVALSHLVFDMVTTGFLVEALFLRFRRVPFTCKLLRGKLQLGVFAVAYVYAFTTYTSTMGGLKQWLARDPRHMGTFLIVSALLFGGILIDRSFRRRNSQLVFDESDSPIQQLNLS
jgi:hypothetical protein